MDARRLITRGMVAGFVAAVVFAVCFLLVDVVQSRPFRTPVYMSELLLSGRALPLAVKVALFTILHFAAFGLAGVVAAALLAAAEIKPNIGLGLVYGFVLFDVVFYGSVVLLGVDILRALGWPPGLLGN